MQDKGNQQEQESSDLISSLAQKVKNVYGTG